MMKLLQLCLLLLGVATVASGASLRGTELEAPEYDEYELEFYPEDFQEDFDEELEEEDMEHRNLGPSRTYPTMHGQSNHYGGMGGYVRYGYGTGYGGSNAQYHHYKGPYGGGYNYGYNYGYNRYPYGSGGYPYGSGGYNYYPYTSGGYYNYYPYTSGTSHHNAKKTPNHSWTWSF